MAGSFRAGFDGGSRGNPGPAAWGVVVLDDQGHPVSGHAGAIGRSTNNVAEYRALLEALALAERAGASDVKLFADSELVVKQMRGEYKVRHPDLIPLHAEAKSRASRFPRFSLVHVPRERNKDADRLVNRALNLGENARVEERFDAPAAAE
jgi:probable phosphoglycerate mutase